MLIRDCRDWPRRRQGWEDDRRKLILSGAFGQPSMLRGSATLLKAYLSTFCPLKGRPCLRLMDLSIRVMEESLRIAGCADAIVHVHQLANTNHSANVMYSGVGGARYLVSFFFFWAFIPAGMIELIHYRLLLVISCMRRGALISLKSLLP